ncbi:hypothetical protein [Streptomyces virginiae]|uniref:hypothetical protein n=1 Tax=Streptomyces virginiae TaxID=1961 RepID=UPI00249FF4A1|nr:hypothetical protein Slala04_42290 [Streptomyces lavendulae subsp. lavendulae]
MREGILRVAVDLGPFLGDLAGEEEGLTEPVGGVFPGSSDTGDVRSRVPAIHPFVAIIGDEASDHTPAFARAARAWARQHEKMAAGL